ncbi:putative agmatine deiminase [Hydractinia symbiolongicarpus]|uniref:putative agmatine deiminase n=1 Tax=Hydractinia symbiolongicarpus TaxID=13093 RepID=UPI00255139EF|nr:putative agmatine deiminase [Hydractinia symbiolongicarpus]
MLLVLSVPSVKDSYYKKHFKKMVDFYIAYANAIIGKDDVIILTDKATMPYMVGRVPNEILLVVEQHLDAWIRDFSPVLSNKSIQFKYYGGINAKEAKFIQKQFNAFLDKYEIEYTKIDLVNDGGNIVYNGNNCVITTDKFLELNNLTEADGVKALSDVLKVEHVIVLPADDEKLGHIDGMCSFVNEKTLFLLKYEDDEKFRSKIKVTLEKCLPKDIVIKEIECGESCSKAKGGFVSSYGLYVNCVPTEHFIYIPIFGNALDNYAMKEFQHYASGKECVFVDARNVCDLGGSLRCLSWQVSGKNAEKLINAAKNES